jgi:hypothetical protein
MKNGEINVRKERQAYEKLLRRRKLGTRGSIPIHGSYWLKPRCFLYFSKTRSKIDSIGIHG